MILAKPNRRLKTALAIVNFAITVFPAPDDAFDKDLRLLVLFRTPSLDLPLTQRDRCRLTALGAFPKWRPLLGFGEVMIVAPACGDVQGVRLQLAALGN